MSVVGKKLRVGGAPTIGDFEISPLVPSDRIKLRFDCFDEPLSVGVYLAITISAPTRAFRCSARALTGSATHFIAKPLRVAMNSRRLIAFPLRIPDRAK